MNDIELKWNEFKMNVDLHRQYLELTLKLNLFYYAITGAILSFYFTNTDLPFVKFSLLLPMLLSGGLSVLLLFCARLAYNLKNNMMNQARDLGFKFYPSGAVLVALCVIFGLAIGIVAIALGWFFLQTHTTV